MPTSIQTPAAPDPADIRALRAAAGLTQVQAAQMIGGAMRAWQDYEAGVRGMHPGLWALFRARCELAAGRRAGAVRVLAEAYGRAAAPAARGAEQRRPAHS